MNREAIRRVAVPPCIFIHRKSRSDSIAPTDGHAIKKNRTSLPGTVSKKYPVKLFFRSSICIRRIDGIKARK